MKWFTVVGYWEGTLEPFIRHYGSGPKLQTATDCLLQVPDDVTVLAVFDGQLENRLEEQK